MTKGQIAVTFMDDSERFFPVPEESGWRVRTEYGAPTLVIGRGVPRIEIPLANVRYYEVSPLPSRPSRGPLASIAEAVAAGRCPGCDRPFDAPDVSCHESAGGGWVCSRSVEAAPDPVEVEDVVQWAEQQARRCRSAFLFVDHGMATCGLPGGHAGPHEDRGLRWDDTPTTEGPGRDDISADRCPVAANQRGVHIPCDLETDHAGRAHANREHQIIWSA